MHGVDLRMLNDKGSILGQGLECFSFDQYLPSMRTFPPKSLIHHEPHQEVKDFLPDSSRIPDKSNVWLTSCTLHSTCIQCSGLAEDKTNCQFFDIGVMS